MFWCIKYGLLYILEAETKSYLCLLNEINRKDYFFNFWKACDIDKFEIEPFRIKGYTRRGRF